MMVGYQPRECQHKECFVEVNDPIHGKKYNRIKSGKEYVGCYTLNKNCDCKCFEQKMPLPKQKPWWKFLGK